jgi:hypothetical protein
MGRRIAVVVLAAGALFALWIALVDHEPLAELVAGAVCALLAAGAAERAGLLGRVSVIPRPRWIANLARLPWWIARDGTLVLWALARGLARGHVPAGAFRPLSFPGARGESGQAVARRALAEGAGSAGPNAYTVGVEDDVLLVHQLLPRPSLPSDLVE